jgi:hypothetical protein
LRFRFRISRLGFALAVAFVLVAGALFALHVHSFLTKPGDSGESGLWFFLCTLPWAFLLPEAAINAPWWDGVSYYVSWAFIAWNAFLLYCLSGGLTLAPRAPDQARRSSLTSR